MAKKSGFQFKQFFIEHADAAMKVGTDSIMLGSWVEVNGASRILDVGTGSGLLAIMLAQKASSGAKVVGVDISHDAISQALTNAELCPWPQKLDFITTDVQQFICSERFDLIISNPPYFVPKAGKLCEQDPHFIESARRTARHTVDLDFVTLIFNVNRLMADTGRFYCVLPVIQGQQLIEQAAISGLHCNHCVRVLAHVKKQPNRLLMMFSRKKTTTVVEEIAIRQITGEYTAAYKNLCKDYYLNF